MEDCWARRRIAEVSQDRSEVSDYFSGRDSGDEFGFCGAGSNDFLQFGLESNGSTTEHYCKSGDRVPGLGISSMSGINKACEIIEGDFREVRESWVHWDVWQRDVRESGVW
jgi:hypothetical protein